VVVVGRADDCDLVMSHPSVSGHHARLSWSGGRIVIEDLHSTNGVLVDGCRVHHAVVRPGDDVRLGDAPLPWSDARLRAFLRAGARGDTMVGVLRTGRGFECSVCGTAGTLPDGAVPSRIRCAGCGETLTLEPPRRRALTWPAVGVVGALLVAGASVGAWVLGRPGRARDLAREVVAPVREVIGGAEAEVDDPSPPRSAQERAIRARVAPAIAAAIDGTDPVTRNLAVRIASGSDGSFHVEQVARLWTHVRGRWKYVSDPRGSEYFAKASETIANEFAGDCDDFAIVLTAMITAVGGQARVVVMDGPEGGHAYAEACVQQEPREVARRLATHYRRTWDRYLGRQRVTQVSFRSSEDCKVWLNLDWSAGVPGGPYQVEHWAVAIDALGRTQTLAPAGQVHAEGSVNDAASTVRAAALLPR
jgi:hypothetical protein